MRSVPHPVEPPHDRQPGDLMRTIGVISDTHGLLRPEALDALAGSELIIHAGDVGNQEILGMSPGSP